MSDPLENIRRNTLPLMKRIQDALNKHDGKPAEPEIDVVVENHGSILLVRSQTEIADLWIDTNISDESQWYGEALVVEPRYIEPIIQGMREEGLNVLVS